MAAYHTHLPLQSLATMLLAYAIGSTVLHSAACVLNDICDRDFDRQVGQLTTKVYSLVSTDHDV
jgi:4-hydroxybenzoate polyprenyltransferase